MDVWHQPDAAARHKFLVQQLHNLRYGCLIHNVGENLGLVILTLQFYHNTIPKFSLAS